MAHGDPNEENTSYMVCNAIGTIASNMNWLPLIKERAQRPLSVTAVDQWVIGHEIVTIKDSILPLKS